MPTLREGCTLSLLLCADDGIRLVGNMSRGFDDQAGDVIRLTTCQSQPLRSRLSANILAHRLGAPTVILDHAVRFCDLRFQRARVACTIHMCTLSTLCDHAM